MLYYVKHLKNFKHWGKGLKLAFIGDLIRNILFVLVGVGLYLWLDNTGLLVYIILMLNYHWMKEKEGK